MKPLKRMKVALLGLGQIGGSIGRDLVERKLVGEVIGYDHDLSVVRKARRLKAVDRSVGSLDKAIVSADLIVIALPIRATLKIIPRMAKLVRPDQGLLDVTSTKSVLFDILDQSDAKLNYVSGHPLAGNEGVGIDASEIGLFDKMPFVLLPHKTCSSDWIKRITYLVRRLGAKPFQMEPERHDWLTSLSIQTPYFLAYLLSRMAIRQTTKDRAFWDVTGGSIKGATRVMKSSAELTLDMLLTNKQNVIDRIDELSSELDTLRSLLKENDQKELARQLKVTRKKLLRQT